MKEESFLYLVTNNVNTNLSKYYDSDYVACHKVTFTIQLFYNAELEVNSDCKVQTGFKTNIKY